MIIDRAELFLVPLRLREPFATAGGTTDRRAVLLVAVHAEGRIGWGECVAGETPAYSSETTETAWHVLTTWILPALVGRGRDPAWIRGHPMARAAAEMAAWDLRARADGVPLCEALGGTRRPVPVGLSLGLQSDADALLARVEEGIAEGYRRIKLKIEPGRDVDTLRAVRDRFPDVPLSVDANGAYTPADLPRLRELDAFELLMIEQPLASDDLLGHARVQEALRTPLCLDESIGSPADARLALELGACRVVNLKPGRVGGFGPAREVHDVCVAATVPVWCGGMLESGVGRAHNLALATLPGFTLPGDLSPSRRYWERDLVTPEWEMQDGAMTPLDAPGIGVEPDRTRIETLAVRRAVFERG